MNVDNLEEAEKHYLKAIEINDIYPHPHYNLARVYIKKGDIELAIKHLERSIEINPNFFYSYYLLSDIFKALGEHKKAKEYYQKAKRMKYFVE